MKLKKGKIASQGIALGQVHIMESPKIEIKEQTCDDTEKSLKKLNESVEKSTKDLETIRENAERSMGQEEAEIFDAHIQMVNDPELLNQTKAMIEGEKLCPDAAFDKVANQFIEIFSNMDDDYFKERAADIKDIKTRVLLYLQDKTPNDPSLIEKPTIVVAHDLTPSDTASLNLEYVKGFITEVGGLTSHSAIMARALGIPAIVGAKDIIKDLSNDDFIILDAIDHNITINPNEKNQEEAQKKLEKYQAYLETLKQYKDEPTQTKDGFKIPLFANIGSPNEVSGITQNGAEGVGLFRTEFLFMESDTMPDEKTQIEAYKKVFETVQPVIVRTLDIGGDKNIPYISQPKEDNPFLGKRAVRLCFDEIELFKTQLRALLIAAKDQKEVRIMIPMVAIASEIRKVKSILEDVKADLKQENISYQNNIQLGIMIEIPAAALNADALAKEVDFFSIGTNDLIQYLFAADRMNESVGYLYEPYDPTLLRLIHSVIKAAKNNNVEIGMCGELAGKLDIALVLSGMEIDELSMSPANILEIRKTLNTLNHKDLIQLSQEVLNASEASEVKKIIKQFKDDNL